MQRYSLKAAVLALITCACGGNTLVGSRYVKSVPVTASQGATIVINNGDEPSLAGTALVIPPGALARDTVVTLDLGLTDVVKSPGVPAGPVAIWGPSGTVFAKPVQMTLPFKPVTGQSSDTLFVDVWEDNGSHTTLPRTSLTVGQSFVQFNVTGFTRFQPATGNVSCRTDLDCPGGEACINGNCEAVFDGGQADGGADCRTDRDCPSGDFCASNNQCQPSACQSDCRIANCAPPLGICQPGDGITCDQATGNWTCTQGFDAGCGNGGVCDGGQADAGQCTQRASCQVDGDCGAGGTCVSGVCECGAIDGGQFDAGSFDGGQCMPRATCNTDLDCGGGFCANGFCDCSVDGGTSDGGQPADSGVVDAGRGPGDAGQVCRTDTDCQFPQHCINLVCQ